MCMIPLTSILRKEEAGYRLGKDKSRKINHLLFMDDLKLYGKNEKEAEVLTNTTRIFANDNGIWNTEMWLHNNGKRKCYK